MSSDTIITVENLGKRYRLGAQKNERYTALRDVIAEKARSLFRNPQSAIRNGSKADASEFWALRDVSFEVKQGEVLGIIGRNGAGKSTLLKILSRITEPTEGRVRIKGRVASLLEVGTGFHPELTGRENIFLNGAILGMTRAEIIKKFDEIVAFAETEKFLDTPVKRYSSGMYVRLAFAVAAHLEPEILVIDEVLAVGDAEFQKKCLGKMHEVSKGGRTVLFVSHNMGVVTRLTQRCIYLKGGVIAAAGESHNIVETYLRQSFDKSEGQRTDLEFYRRDQHHDSPVKMTGVGVNGKGCNLSALPTIEVGSAFTINLQLDVARAVHGALMVVALKTSRGERAAVLLSWDQNYALFLEPGRRVVDLKIIDLPLAPGEYFVDVGINQSIQTTAFDVILDFPLFRVANNGQITHWLERPWGILHCQSITWEQR
jgi:lipopolysaccharide transport system ATP-binding protein